MKKQSGYVALLSVVVIGVIAIMTMLAFLVLGTGYTKNALVIQNAAEARAQAQTCIESALDSIRANNAFSGSGSISFGTKSCGYLVQVGIGPARTIFASSTVGLAVSRLQVSISTLTPKILIDSWQEVSN